MNGIRARELVAKDIDGINIQDNHQVRLATVTMNIAKDCRSC
jgi:hypothetical protein